MIEIELVGGPNDGERWRLPDHPGNPRPAVLVALPDSAPPSYIAADQLYPPAPVPDIGMYDLTLGPLGRPSRDDQGVFRYRWKDHQ